MKLSIVLFALSQTQAMRLCNFFCPMMLDEVCGTDGNTYGNFQKLRRPRSGRPDWGPKGGLIGIVTV